jgi:hypothetical protein
MSYNTLLNDYKNLLDSQPEEVRETLTLGEKYTNDSDIQAVLEYLSKQEVQYITYSHS